MANYPVKLLKDKDGTAFIPVVNSDSIITPEGNTLNDLLEEKQDLLTSGTNIKTINNESLLGSGNISIDDIGGTVTSVKINATSPIAIDNNAAITTSGERTISHANSGVTAGTYKSVTVDSKGHVTAGTNPTTLSGYGITDAKISNGTITLGSNTITPSTVQNIKDGSSTGSLRSSGSSTENANYTIGSYAFAEGNKTKASGNASHAEGGYTKAFGANSHAEGWGSEASGDQSHAEGNATVAIGNYSHAEGDHTTASEDYSHSEGCYTTASGNYGAHSEGCNTVAKGSYSHSEGKYTVASKDGSHAEGYWARAVGKNSHSEGGWDSSSPYNIVGTVVSIDTENKTYEVSGLTRYINSDNNYVGAMYYHTSSGSNESYYISSETYDTTTNNFTFGVSYMDSSIVVEGSFYIKISSVALGDFSHSEGRNTFAIGSSSHAEGWNTTARYNGSHAEGDSTYAGPFSHAEGYYTEANGDHSHSEGDHTQANGNYSHSEGYYTEANGKYSHSEGIYTKGTGDYSHVEGWGSEASGSYSHAEGDHTTASGREGSHAEGYATVAAGASSHAEGGYSGYFQQGTVVSVDAENKTYEVSGLPVLYNASGYPIYNGASYSKVTSGYFNDSYIIISSTRSNDNYIFTVSGFYTTIAVGDPFYITMGSKAQGNYSHAEGQTCLAIGSGSHAEGNRTIASGSYSHTEGDHTEASGSSSHAGGYFTKADKSYQTAIGKYNKNVYNALLEIGNGTADDARSNAFVVYSDGRAIVGADPTTAMGVATKQYVDNNSGGEKIPIGTIFEFPTDDATKLPTGYLFCDGSAISRTTYAGLFDVIGTTFGSGDGSTTFNLPNLKGKVPVGLDSSDADFDTLGETGGEKKHTLTQSELPNYNLKGLKWANSGAAITLDSGSHTPGYSLNYGYNGVNEGQIDNIIINSGGSNTPHSNLQPYIVVNYIIKASQTTPVQAQIVDGYSTSTTDGYSANYINQKTNIITAYLANATYSITTSSVYEKIPLDGSEKVGNKLTLNSNGEIVVGAGVTKVKASAKICVVGNTITSGTKNFVIMKNGTIVERIWNKIDAYNSTLIIPMSMFSVAEGDKITMAYYGIKNETANYGSPFTALTVEVVE